ncbi:MULTISPECIES: glycosyltransferase family 4 protein [Novosphingobium]|uniref:glycosyltransferase family 4 protein n=1 Tax=Novosphingobium TaxID=165696 RepID=UPI001CD1F8D5|nr:glycosyltransferase [Novosphingobium percolationis]MCH7629909.1 glycosyltransferase [Pseudomonadota bacterium]
MKVVMVGDYPEPGKRISGGVERVIDTLLPELARTVDLTLIVPAASQDATCDHRGVRTIYMQRARPGSLHYWTSDAVRLARMVENLRPDIVHLQGVAGIGRLVSCPRILTVHGFLHKDMVASARGIGAGLLARHLAGQVIRIVEKRARRRIGHVISINPYVQEALPDIARLERYPIPNPLDPVFVTQDRETCPSRARHIVSVGRIGPRKNTLAVIVAAAKVMRHDPDASLTICGDASDDAYFAKCNDFIAAEGLTGRIRMAGNLSSSELAALLDRASCLVMASRQETAPMAIAEAQARGVAVVAPKAFGIPYMIEPGVNGLFWPVDDPAAQATMLARALDHAWDRVAIARVARETYGARDVAARTLEAYRAVLGGRSDVRRDLAHQR